jgi:hypothetical protein
VTPSREHATTRAKRSIAGARALYREGLLGESHAYLSGALEALLEAWRVEPLPAAAAADVSSTRAGDTAPKEDVAPGEATAPAEVAEAAAPSEPSVVDGEQQALAAIEWAGYRNVARLRKAAAAIHELGQDQVTSLGRVEWIWAEIERLARFSERRFAPPAAQKRARVRRFVLAGSALLLVVAVVMVLWARPRVVASASYSQEYPAYQAYDGVDSSEWLLPESSQGWIELRLRNPRSVRVVRLLNAHNRDRAAERVRVTAYVGDKAVGSAEGKFKGIMEKRSALDLTIKASGVTKVRVEILSFFGRGGGLSEIELR